MTIGFWSPDDAAPPRPEWRRVPTLDGPLPDRLVATGETWRSLADAIRTSTGHLPPVVLVLEYDDAPAPPHALALADAITGPARDAVDSALRLTDTEIADAVGALGTLAIADLLADLHTGGANLGGRELTGLDADRVAAAVVAESRHRALVEAPLRRLLAVEADLPALADQPAARLAAVLLLALLRAGMRIPPATPVRGAPPPPPPDPPDEATVATLLEDGVSLPALVPGAALEFTLTPDGLAVTASAPIAVAVRRGDEIVWTGRGRAVTLPTDVLRGDAVSVRISPSDG